MNKPDKNLQQLLAESATGWLYQKQTEHTNRFRAAFQDAFEAGWHARDKVKRFHHEAEVESMKKEINKLEEELLQLGEEKDDLQQRNCDLEQDLMEKHHVEPIKYSLPQQGYKNE